MKQNYNNWNKKINVNIIVIRRAINLVLTSYRLNLKINIRKRKFDQISPNNFSK